MSDSEDTDAERAYTLHCPAQESDQIVLPEAEKPKRLLASTKTLRREDKNCVERVETTLTLLGVTRSSRLVGPSFFSKQQQLLPLLLQPTTITTITTIPERTIGTVTVTYAETLISFQSPQKTIVQIVDFGCGRNHFAKKLTRIVKGKEEDLGQVKFRLDAIDFLKDVPILESYSHVRTTFIVFSTVP